MSGSTLPELWRAFLPRPARPPVNWRNISSTVALTLAAGALIWAGATLLSLGEPKLGWWMIGVGMALFVLAAQVDW